MRSTIKRLKHISDEVQYLNLIKNTLSNGSLKKTRNGKTLSTIGAQMRFNLKDNTVPL